MARFNEILAGRLNRAIQKFTGIKGSPPAPQLSSEMMATFPFFWGVENRYLEGWNMHSWDIVFAASAANLNAAMLRNPVGSGIIAVFVKVVAANFQSTSDSYTMSLGPRTTDLPTASPIPAPSNFDRRSGSSQRSNLIGSIQQAAGPGTAPPDRASVAVLGTTFYDFIVDACEEFPMLPGDAIAMRNGTVNQATAYTFWWRERPLEDSEVF